MKKLKRFNEEIDHDELRDFVKDCLIYLIDDGFQIFIPKLVSDDCKVIWLSISDKHVVTRGLGANTFAGTPFTWDQIKDYYIPQY